MPQGPQAISVTNTVAMNPYAATAAVVNLTAATALRTSAVKVVRFSVVVAGTAGGLFDAPATGTGTAGKQIAVVPATVGVYELNWPCSSGLVVVPGTSQTIAVSLA